MTPLLLFYTLMNPIQLFDTASSTYTYVLFDENTRQALIIDPVDDLLDRDLQVLREYGLTLRWTLETHAHADHITSAALLAEHTGAQTVAPAACQITTAAVQLSDGDTLEFGAQRLQAIHTPGHTAGSMCYFWDQGASRHVFTGDTLLINGCGRTDFQSGSSAALYHSLTQRLFGLPEDTVVWPGHDYHGRSYSTIAIEKSTNARVAGKSLEQFVALMDALDLPRPKRIDEAVPANLSSGLRHDAVAADVLLPRSSEGYAGDLSPQLAYKWWRAGEAVLIDVRSDAEREWVGFVPDALAIAWKQWPGMVMNPDFDSAVATAGACGRKLLFLCRSGARSIAAAKRATALGFESYNILEGFEGDPDSSAHRGRRGGWRFHGLPWRQG